MRPDDQTCDRPVRTVLATLAGAAGGVLVGAFGGAGLTSWFIDTSGLGGLAMPFFAAGGAGVGMVAGATVGYWLAHRVAGQPVSAQSLGVVAVTLIVASGVAVGLLFVVRGFPRFLLLIPLSAIPSALLGCSLGHAS